MEDWFDLNFYFYISLFYRNFTFHTISKKIYEWNSFIIYIGIKKQAKFKITIRDKIKNKNLRVMINWKI